MASWMGMARLSARGVPMVRPAQGAAVTASAVAKRANNGECGSHAANQCASWAGSSSADPTRGSVDSRLGGGLSAPGRSNELTAEGRPGERVRP